MSSSSPTAPAARPWGSTSTSPRSRGAQLVTLDDLRLQDGRLADRAGGRPVDVLYRRDDQDGARTASSPTSRGSCSSRGSTVASGSSTRSGTGVADDKLAHAYVPETVRFYLGEEPLLETVGTLDLGRPESVEEVLGDLRSHVIKPRSGAGGTGVVVCSHADEDTLAKVRRDLEREPTGYVAQRTVALSSHPTIADEGRLEPRHIDLRPFIFSGPGWTAALPGGLTRVALQRGTLVVNSSQHGGGKDTWVLPA